MGQLPRNRINRKSLWASRRNWRVYQAESDPRTLIHGKSKGAELGCSSGPGVGDDFRHLVEVNLALIPATVNSRERGP